MLIAVMAAGQSTRFNGCKLLAKYRGVALIDHSLEQIERLRAEFGLSPTYIVTGAYHQALSEHLCHRPSVRILYNACWEQGLGESIAFCSRALPQDTHLCIVLADQVGIDYSALRALLNQASANPRKIVCTKFTNGGGVPVVFPPQWRHDLNQFSGRAGAKKIIEAAGAEAMSISLPNAQLDIDTQEDLLNAHTQNQR